MKIQIRRSVFETNSSSMHSLCITKTNKKNDCKIGGINSEGIWEIPLDDLYFGRYPYRFLNTFEGKICYTLASCSCDDNFESVLEEIKAIIKKYNPEFKDIKLPKSRFGNYDGLINSRVIKKGITMEDFLTEARFNIVVDGDEYHVFSHFMDLGIIDLQNIKNVKEQKERW